MQLVHYFLTDAYDTSGAPQLSFKLARERKGVGSVKERKM